MGYVKHFKAVEDRFTATISEFGKTSPATKNEDINEHWDVKLEVKFDVKAIKKIKRSDNEVDETIHWVELINVRGNMGWLYGSADYFVFETEDYWLVTDKIVLQDFISNKCKDKIKCNRPSLYKLYTREGRNDVITLVKTVDLMYLSEQIIKKIKL